MRLLLSALTCPILLTNVLLTYRQQDERRQLVSDWIKPFFVTSVFRSDLLRVSLTQEQAAAFTDEDMLTIAQIMQVKYLEDGFYTHLLAAVEHVMQKKEEQRQ